MLDHGFRQAPVTSEEPVKIFVVLVVEFPMRSQIHHLLSTRLQNGQLGRQACLTKLW